MPRATDGTVTLPAGNPVVSGTVISPDVHNNTIADLASMIEDSLSRSGFGGMNVPLTFQTGTVSAPGLAFDGDPNTGLYRPAVDNPAVAAGGVKAQEWTATGTTVPGTLAVTGAATVGGTMGITGNTTVGGTLAVTGATTLAALTLGGALTGQIGMANLPTITFSLSESIATASTSSPTYASVVDGGGKTLNGTASVTLTSVRPILVSLQGTNAGLFRMWNTTNGAQFRISCSVNGAAYANVFEWGLPNAGEMTVPPTYIDIRGAGTYQYKVEFREIAGGSTAIQNAQLAYVVL